MHGGIKSWAVAAKNRFEAGGAVVIAYALGIDVVSASGQLLAKAMVDGLGNLVDVSKEFGAKFDFDRSPIPRNTRVYKQCPKTHHIIRDEQAEDREPVARELAKAFGGRVPSIDECEAAGLEVKHEPKHRHNAEVKLKAAPAPEAAKSAPSAPVS